MENTIQNGEPVQGKEDQGALGIIILLAFLIPAMLVPVVGVPLQFTKVLVAALGAIALVAVYVGSALRRRTLSLSWSPLVAGLVLLPIAYAVAALFSTHPASSFFGYELDQDTFGFALVASVLALSVFWSLKAQKGVFSVLLALLAGGWLVLLFQAAQVFFSAPFGLPAIASAIANPIGKWNDLALFAGLIVSLALVCLESLSISRLGAIALYATMAVSLFFLALVNLGLAWVLVGLFAFVVFIFALTRRSGPSDAPALRQPLPNVVPSAAVLLVVLFFLFVGSGIPSSLQQSFGTQSLEVRPSSEGTLTILSSVYQKNPVFGSGPNTFAADWLLYRPADVLKTVFWNSEFNAGFGYLPTVLTTGGLVVGVAWAVLIVLFGYVGIRYLFGPAARDRSVFAVATTGSGILYLLVAHLFYVPSSTLTLILFLLLGLFLASMHGTTAVKTKVLSFADNPRVGFVATLILVVVIMASFASVVGIGRLYASGVEYGKAVFSLSQGNYDRARERAFSSLSLSDQDRSYQIVALSSLAKLNVLMNSQPADAAAQNEFRNLLSDAISASGQAVQYNGQGFNNWMVRASIYASVVPLRIDGAFENASKAYEEARKLNPGTPEIDFALAQLYQSQGQITDARTKVEAALAKKADYTPAILLAGQIALDEGKLKEAIESVKSALVFEPQNSVFLYQLGVLFLADKDYANAVLALEAALVVNPQYANAKFFLGQTYAFLGKDDDALALFRGLAGENPENQVVKDIILALEGGKNPFSGGVEAPPEPKVNQ